MRKLIGMTEFVFRLDQSKDYVDENGFKPYFESAIDQSGNMSLSECFRKCIKYAKFLSQPLTLSMFVPCDLEVNVLDYNEILSSVKEGTENWNIWENAVDRVIFQGFSILYMDSSEICINNKSKFSILFSQHSKDIQDDEGNNLNTIEDLVKHSLELTPSANKIINN